MPRVRGLTAIVATADPERFRAALTLACAAAALGGRASVYCHEAAVALLDARRPADPGPPGTADSRALIAAARESGVRLIACQTGLAALGLDFSALVAGAEAGGPVSLLAALDDDRLVTL